MIEVRHINMADFMFKKQYATYYDLFNSEKPYRRETQFVHNWAGKPNTIFDIGCGTACYWQYYPVGTCLMGVDKSEHMILNTKNVICEDITKYKHKLKPFDCATAIFDVINYIPKHTWWKNIPIEKGGYFIFDVWDRDKVDNDGFQLSIKIKNGITRTISAIQYDKGSVDLRVEVSCGSWSFFEDHKMYIHSHKDIKKFCGKKFDIVDIKETTKWQKWYKIRKK